MIAVVGDIHGLPDKIQKIDDHLPNDVSCVLQVGDLGWYEFNAYRFADLKLRRPWMFIRGNHEQHELLCQFEKVTEVAPNLFFVPDGTVLELEGQQVGFLGGAASVDKEFRIKRGVHWTPLEQTTDEAVAKFDNIDHLDLLIAHTPPQEIIVKHFDPMDLVNYFDLPLDWKDPSAFKVQAVWDKFNKCPLIAGHMHKSITDGNCKILNIDEVFIISRRPG